MNLKPIYKDGNRVLIEPRDLDTWLGNGWSLSQEDKKPIIKKKSTYSKKKSDSVEE